jgi:hypothetical protein
MGRQQTLQSSTRDCILSDVSISSGNDSPQCGQVICVSTFSSILDGDSSGRIAIKITRSRRDVGRCGRCGIDLSKVKFAHATAVGFRNRHQIILDAHLLALFR